MNYIIALLLVLQSAETPEWHKIGTDKDGSVLYVRTQDAMAGRSHHRAAKVWTKMDARKDRTVAWSEAKILYLMDCVAQTYRIVQIISFDSKGDPTTIQGNGKTDHVVPGSMMEGVADAVCSDPADNRISLPIS